MDQSEDRKKRKEELKKKKLEKFAQKQKKIDEQKINNSKKPVKDTIKTQNIVEKTPEGQFKKLKLENFDPVVVEEGWFSWWEKNGFFRPEITKKSRGKTLGPYIMAIPPPNVTGKLHIGHAMMIAIQDSIARYKRMIGYDVLFVPGTDHAGIATQTVVEKKLLREDKLTKHDLGREKFLEKVWEWKENYGNNIINQMKRMGASVDMSRLAFTLDEERQKSVTEAFVRLYEKGMIYRDEKLVNWCAKLNTAISDLEVEHREIAPNTKLIVDEKEYTFGVLYHFKYPICSKESDEITDYLEIATTRPETIIGDTALCMNPSDTRMKYFSEKMALNPITGSRIPIIFDDFADLNFGSGVVKITPGHDFKDFEIGKKYNLKILQIMNEQNIITESIFKGKKRFDVRLETISLLKEKNLFLKIEPYTQTLPLCSRSGDVLEPILKKQWWMRCDEIAIKSIDAVRTGDLQLIPEQAITHWNHWLHNIRDWCLSRQLWWGHRIPAYRVFTTNENKYLGWIISRSQIEALENAKKQFKVEKIYLEQDEDVLDTWFSSALWPFSIFGWPDSTDDLKKYFPNTILETGSDILFFWVARMVMVSYALHDKLPFKTVLLHGIVRDANGRKMSKSLGNVIDPIHVMEGISLEKLYKTVTETNLNQKEISKALDSQKKDYPNGIPRCGADALRFTLCSYTSGMKDVNLNINRVEGYRKFCNKLWNAYKFVDFQIRKSKLKKLQIDEFITNFLNNKDILSESIIENPEKFNSENAVIEWILMHRNALIQEYTIEMENFNFMIVTQKIYSFFLNTFCDFFIEITKKSNNISLISACVLIMNDILLLLHPFMPFITEELFQNLKNHKLLKSKKSITIENFPTTSVRIFTNNYFQKIISVLKTVRSLIASNISLKNVIQDFEKLTTKENLKDKNLLKFNKEMKVKVYVNKKEIILFENEMKSLCKNIHSVEFRKEIFVDLKDEIENVVIGIEEYK